MAVEVSLDLKVPHSLVKIQRASKTDLLKGCIRGFQVRSQHLNVIHDQVKQIGKQV